MKKLSTVLLLAALAATSAVADVVYVTSTCSNAISTTVCGSEFNPDLNVNGSPVYADNDFGNFTSAVATKPDGPVTPGARYFSNAFSNSTPDLGVTINPVLGNPGGVYRLYHIYTSINGNVSSNIVVGVTNVENCTLNFNQTDKFQASYGLPAAGINVYQQLGFVTNNVGTNSPKITFYFLDGMVNAGVDQRLIVDTFKFAYEDPCLNVPAPGITGPLGASLTNVVVTGVSNAATKITVYQDSGAGMVQIGSLTSGIVSNINNVPVTGLVKGAKVAATQTLGGVEGCKPAAGSGLVVGGGANPSVRLCLSIRETTSTGPVGAPGVSTNANLHFLGATTRSGGAPADSPIIYPSNDWQTVTLSLGRQYMGNSANVAGAVQPPPGANSYPANSTAAITVYAFKTVNGTTIYSPAGAQSVTVTSNAAFVVNWTWDAVPGAEGYRLLWTLNGGPNTGGTDVTGTSYFDDYLSWSAPNITVTPSSIQLTPSILWNGDPAGATNIPTTWGIFESLAFSIADATDTGPYKIYVDNIKNGATVFQTFETAPANTTDYGFRVPSLSGSTSGNILAAPDVGSVYNLAADTGTKSFGIQFQWNSTASTRWLRFTTSGVNNPQVNLDDPITIRLLMQPVGATPPVRPAAPTLSESYIAGQTVLNWVGGHRLQTSVAVPGTYTNIPQGKTTSNWTNIWNGNFLSPWTNNYTEPTRFFRLLD